jgi:hypothetical protein
MARPITAAAYLFITAPHNQPHTHTSLSLSYCTVRQVDRTTADIADAQSRLLRTTAEEVDLLRKVLDYNCAAYDQAEESVVRALTEGEADELVAAGEGSTAASAGGGIKRRVGSLAALSGV